MRLSRSTWFCALLAGLAACQPSGESAVAARDEIWKADVAFDLVVAEKDLASFKDMIDDDAVFYGLRDIYQGRAAVVQNWAPLFEAEASTTLRWQPIQVNVARSGDLGYSRGEYKLTTIGEDGNATTTFGSYVTVWQKSDQDGRWRAVVDIGTPPQAERSPAVE